MANLVIADKFSKTPSSQAPSRPASSLIKYGGNFGATEGSETTVDIIPVDAYRSVIISYQASAWGTATVALKVYPCDSNGNTNANPFFSISLTANTGPLLLFIAEMGGLTSTATWPATAASAGAIIGPFGNWLKITEQCTAFSSGTNTVALEVTCKG
jgi:hypothetical protein